MEKENILTAKSRILGVDCGRARIGIAQASGEVKLATPLKTVTIASWIKSADAKISDDQNAIEEICAIVFEEQIDLIVFGLPVNLQGDETENCEEIRQFARALQNLITEKGKRVEIEFCDERFSTVQAHAQLHELGKQPSRERAIIDQLAAVNILQSWLESKK